MANSTPSNRDHASKIALFHQRLAELKANRDAESPDNLPPAPSTGPVNPSADIFKRSSNVQTWPLVSCVSAESGTSSNNVVNVAEGISLDLNGQMDREHANAATASNGKSLAAKQHNDKENSHPNSYATMRKIMKDRQERNKSLATNQQGQSQQVDAKSANNRHTRDEDKDTTSNNNNLEKNKSLAETFWTCNGDSVISDDEMSSINDRDISGVSAWAMMGPHLNETLIEDDSIESASRIGNTPLKYSLTPGKKSKQGSNQLEAEMLSFLGSPLFEGTIVEESQFEESSVSNDEINTSRNVMQTKQAKNNIEDSFIGKIDGILSPVLRQTDNFVDEPEKEVTWAIDGGWNTPNLKKKKDDFQNSDLMTPSKGESLMNESVIISDDEASVDNGGVSASMMCNLGSPSSFNDLDIPASLDESSECQIEIQGLVPKQGKRVRSNSRDKSASSSSGRRSPTSACLMERNKTLVKEVRFADQTCVELAEKNKYYKNEAGRFKRDLAAANNDISHLRSNHEASLQENATLKAMVELLQNQKHHVEEQVKSYRVQIADSEESHRSNLMQLEETYQSHLKNSEKQVNSLNGRLDQSLADKAILQSKLEKFHAKWESKFEEDLSSRDLISSLKEQITSRDASLSKADASINAMEARIHDLQGFCHQQQDELHRERSEREMIEHDRDDLQHQCEDLHKQLTDWVQTSDTLGDILFDDDGSQNEIVLEELKFTPVKALPNDTSATPCTPTSNLLARTLRSELKRRQEATDKLEHAEQQAEHLQKLVSDMKIDLEEARADNALLEEELEEKVAYISGLEENLKDKNEIIAELEQELDGNDQSDKSSLETTPKEQGEVEVLEERLDLMEGALESAEDEILKTRQKQIDAESQRDKIVSELERSESKLDEAREQLLDYEERLDELETALESSDTELAKSKEALEMNESKQDKLLEIIESKSRKLESMKDMLSQSEKLNRELQTQLNSCLQSLVALEKILHTYECTDGTAKQQWGEYSRRIARLVEAIQIVQECLSSPQRKGEFQGSTCSDENDSNSSGSRFDTVVESVSSWHLEEEDDFDNASSTASDSTHDKSSTSNNSYQRKLARLHDEATATNEYLVVVKKERDDANEKLFKALRHLQDFRDVISKQESEFTVQETSLRNQISKHEKEKTLSKNEREALVQECNQLKQKLSAISIDLDNYKSKADSSKGEDSQKIAALKRHNFELNGQNEILLVKLQSYEIQLEQEKDLLRATDEGATRMRKELQVTNDQLKSLQSESDRAKAQLEQHKQNVYKLDHEISQKEKELKACQETLFHAQDTLRVEKIQFDDKTKELENTIHDLEFQMSEVEHERVEAESHLADASKHVKLLEKMFKLKEEECDINRDECERLESQVKSKEEDLSSVKDALATANAKYLAVQETDCKTTALVTELKGRMQENERRLASKEQSLIDFKNEIRQLKNEITRLQRTISEKDESHQISMRVKDGHINTLEKAHKDRQAQFESKTSDLEDMIEKLSNEIHAINRAHQESGDKAKSIIAAKEASLMKCEDEVKQCRSIISTLESELLEQNDAQKHLEEDIVKHQGEIDTLQVLLNEESEKYNISQHDIQQAGDEILLITKKLQSLEVDYKDLEQRNNKTQQDLESSLMDIERMKFKHEDDEASSSTKVKELLRERDTLISKSKSAEESLKSLAEERNNFSEKL